jgi:hypothetical protein
MQVIAAIAQLVARRSHNPKVVSSILTGGIIFRYSRATEKMKRYFVPGSNRGPFACKANVITARPTKQYVQIGSPLDCARINFLKPGKGVSAVGFEPTRSDLQ